MTIKAAGTAMKTIRDRHNLSRKTMAAILKCGKTTIERIETGEAVNSSLIQHVVQEFCRIFDIKEPTSNDVKESTPNIERLVKSLSEQEKERIILLAIKAGVQK